MTPYTTPTQALADAERLALASHLDALPAHELTSIERLVQDPATDSDTLILLAEELERFAARAPETRAARAMRQIAAAVAALAPTRANPIEPAP